MERQFDACQTPHSMYPSMFNSFTVIRTVSGKKSPFSRTATPHFGFPWGRSWSNHAKCCIDRKRIRCLQIVSLHVRIYLQQFPSNSNRKCKNRCFHVPQPTFFVSPGDAPAIMTQYVASMERQFNVCHPLVECAYLTITVSEILVENGLLLGNYTDKKY